MILTPDQGYKGTRVQIYEPPPLPPGTLTLNPSGVTKPLPFPSYIPFATVMIPYSTMYLVYSIILWN